MYFSFLSTQDSTLYEYNYRRNSGIDQILELTKRVPGVPDIDGGYYSDIYNSRLLIQFDVQDIVTKIQDGTISPSSEFYLSLKATEAVDVPINYSLYVHPICYSWENGQGHYYDFPEITTGVSWQYRDGYYFAEGTEWLSGSLPTATTASYTTVPGGGCWYTGSANTATQSFAFATTPDIRVNVSNIVRNWISGSYTNYGFIVKKSDTDEQSTIYTGDIKFFGRETHTIYMPKLEAVWNDVSFTNTGSLEEVSSSNCIVHFSNLLKEYDVNSKAKISLVARDKYYIPSYSTTRQNSLKRLPTSSYYSILDSVTNDIIVPFDTGSTQLSINSNGNFFYLNMKAFLPERYYKIVVKSQWEGGAVQEIFDEGFYFKVK